MKTTTVAVKKNVATSTDITLSPVVRKALDSLRDPFDQFTSGFVALTVSRDKLAPRFMRAYALWQEEMQAAGHSDTFVDFVRVLVPGLPRDRNAYRAHRAYQAADYLRRLASREEGEASSGPAPATEREALARVTAAFLTVIPEANRAVLFDAMLRELHWTEGKVESLRAAVAEIDPLVTVKEPKGSHSALRLVA